MNKSNSGLQRAVQDLRPEDGEVLAGFVKRAADQRGSGLKNRADLFYQTEPFAREFGEYDLLDPGDRKNRQGFTMSNRLTSIGGRQKLTRYRAMLFAWLSYYHPEEAKAFCAKVSVALPEYEGHPDLSECSSEAVDLFERQKSSIDQSGAPLAGSDTANLVEEEPAQETPAAPPADPIPTKSEPEESSRGLKVRKPFALLAGALVLIAITALGVWNSDLLGSPASGEQGAPQLTSGELGPISQTPSAEPDEVDDDLAADAEQDKEEQEASVEPASPPPTPVPQRTVNPVWNNITGFAWSTKELNYFYPTLQSANRADLLEAARQGNTAAQTLAAVGYHSGRLGKTDHGLEIRDYLRPACANGQGRACTLLGVHYRAGWGVPRNNATAAEFYSKGCRLGNLTGCHYEGMRYLNGEGVARDVPRAIATFTNACELGVGYSCYLLSGIYGQGVGVEQDLERAGQYQVRYQRLRTPQ